MSEIDHGQSGLDQIPELPEQGVLNSAYERVREIGERFSDMTSAVDHAMLEGTSLGDLHEIVTSEVLDPAQALQRALNEAMAEPLEEK